MNDSFEHIRKEAEACRVARLEARIALLEARLGVVAEAPSVVEPPALAERTDPVPRAEDELEFEIGQNWFAKVGVAVLTLGVGFTLSLPYSSLPAGAPSVIGLGLAIGLFGLAWALSRPFEMISGYLRGVAMALLYFATLRLYFFSPRPVLSTTSLAGGTLLVLVVAGNLAFAFHRRSSWLLGLALVMGYATALSVGTAAFVPPAIFFLSVVAIAGSWKCHKPGLAVVGIVLGNFTYLAWAAGNPLLGHPFQFAPAPLLAPALLLAAIVVLAAGPLWPRHRQTDNGLANSCALLSCTIGYGVFLVHTLAAFDRHFAAAQVAASGAFLGLAVLFWVREQSRVSTFFYATTGFMALSMAIIKLAPLPDVFVWLSVQSVVVVATAIWFRSRFIVVANFLIYLAIVLGYVLVSDRETGICVGFGIVALLSARILNWQKDRLELKTELMRNAYLLSALVVFPFALYHLVPGSFVGLAWVGLALFYYGLNLVVRSQKFRWMGHVTLLFTAVYLAVIGTSHFEPIYRVLSFLILGSVMLIVSLLFARGRNRRPQAVAARTATG